MELTNFEQSWQALLSDTDRRIDGIAAALGEDDGVLLAPLRKIREQLFRQGEDVLRQGRLLQIGVMGQIKSGKSTFLNTLLFGGKSVLPRGATPKTANLTVITYGDADTLRVHFYSKDEWEQLTYVAEHGAPAVALPARELMDQARVRGGGDDCIGTGVREIAFEDSDALERQLGQYVGEAGVLAPFVKYAEILLHNDLLKGLSIVDTPGLNDRIYSRVRQTQQCMERCDVVFYLSAASDFMDTADAQLLFEQLPEHGVARMVLLASKYDSALMDSIWNKGSLEAADADNRKRLNRQAKYAVDHFIESTGSVRLAESVRSCLPPLFVSAVVESMVGRTYFDYTDEERRVYDGLAPGGGLDDDTLRAISAFDQVRSRYDQIVQEKQETLLRRGGQILNAALTQLDREYQRLESRFAGKIRMISVPDEIAINAIRTTYERSQTRLASGFAAVFDGLAERIGRVTAEAVAELKQAAETAPSLQEHRAIRNLPKVERVKISKWYKPWTWGKYKELRTTEQVVYTFFATEEAKSLLRSYALNSAALVSRLLAESSDIDGVRRELLAHALTVLGDHEGVFDPAYLRSLVEDTVNALELSPPTADISDRLSELTDRFGKEASGAEQMSQLTEAVEASVTQLRTALAETLDAQTTRLTAQLPSLAETLREGMTSAILKELSEAEGRTRDREQTVARLTQARTFLTK